MWGYTPRNTATDAEDATMAPSAPATVLSRVRGMRGDRRWKIAPASEAAGSPKDRHTMAHNATGCGNHQITAVQPKRNQNAPVWTTHINGFE